MGKGKKHELFKRLFSLLLATTILVPAMGTLTVPAKAAGLTLADLQAKFPQDAYWNHAVGQPNNPDGWTNTPCSHRSHNHKAWDGSCGCNSFPAGKAIQCMAFAYKLQDDAFGEGFGLQSYNDVGVVKSYSAAMNQLKPGDVLRYDAGTYNHSIFITYVNGNDIKYADCNAKGTCRIRWDVPAKKSDYSRTFLYMNPGKWDLSGGAAPSPAPIKPELTLSTGSIALKVGQSVTFYANTKSSSVIYLNFHGSNNKTISLKTGPWSSDGSQRPITVTGRMAGTMDLTVTMRDYATNAVLDSKTIPVKVAPSGTPKITFSPACLDLEVGETATVRMDVAWNGAAHFRTEKYDSYNYSGHGERLSDTQWTLTITGTKAGSMNQGFTFYDSNDAPMASCSLPINVREPEPLVIQPARRSVTLQVGETVSVPVDYKAHVPAKFEALNFAHEAEDPNICETELTDVTSSRVNLRIHGLMAGKTTIPLAYLGIPGKEPLLTVPVEVTVKQRAEPPTVSVSTTKVSTKMGESVDVAVTWGGSIPAGCTLDADSLADSGLTADAVSVALSRESARQARLRITGVKTGNSVVYVSIQDATGRILASAQINVTVAYRGKPARISLTSDTNMFFLTLGESCTVSFNLSGDFNTIRPRHTEGLQVSTKSFSKTALSLSVTATKGGVQGLGVELTDEWNNVLAKASCSFEVAIPFNPGPVDKKDPNTVYVEDPTPPHRREEEGNGGTNSSVSTVGTPGYWTTEQAPGEDTIIGPVTVTVGAASVQAAAGPTHASIPLDGEGGNAGDILQPSGSKPALPVTDTQGSSTAAGSVTIQSDGRILSVKGGAGNTSGASDASSTASEGITLQNAESAKTGDWLGGQKAVASDGSVVSAAVDFTDVEPGKYYSDAVSWAVSNGVTSGISGTTLAPNEACPRGQVVEFMWRAMGCPAPTVTENPFTDVSAGDSCYQAALWAYGAGVTTGATDTTFSPDSTCTRGQVVTFLWRANGKPRASVAVSFSDVSADAYYADSVRWAVEHEITKGTTVAAFSPGNTCTRGQILTFLYRGMA